MPPVDDEPARRPAGRRAGRATSARFPRSPLSGRRVSRPALPRQHRHTYAAGIQRGLPTSIERPASKSPPTRRRRALHPAHILQIGAGGTLTGRQALVPLVRRLVLLAG